MKCRAWSMTLDGAIKDALNDILIRKCRSAWTCWRAAPQGPRASFPSLTRSASSPRQALLDRIRSFNLIRTQVCHQNSMHHLIVFQFHLI